MIRTLLIGIGNMGSNCYLQYLKKCEDINLVGVVRATDNKIKGLNVFQSLEIALEKTKPDLAIISTPHNLHYHQAMLCLEYDCHVLVDKPASLKYEEALHLNELFQKNNKLIVEGLQRRYETLAYAFREMQRLDSIGEIQFMHGLFAHRFETVALKGWRQDPDQAGMGIIDDSAIHLIDLLVYFTNSNPEKMCSKVLKAENGIPHSFTCFFNTTNGITVSASGSYLSPVNTVQEEITIWGTKGALFSRRFCKNWNKKPPSIFYKSFSGSEFKDFKPSELPLGKNLPLKTLIDVIRGRSDRKLLYSELKNTINTHKTIEFLRTSNEY